MYRKLRASRRAISLWALALVGTVVLLTPKGSGAEVLAYVTHSPDLVSVVRAADRAMVATVSVGPSPTGVALSPDGTLAYVAHQGGISVIRTADQVVVATVAVGPSPMEVALSPDGTLAYVAHQGGVSVIRTADQVVVATVAIDQGNCQDIALAPDGSLAYVANANLESVSVIRTADQAVVATVAVGSIPMGVALTPNGAFAYVTNWGSNTVSVIRTLDRAVVATVAVGNRPWGVAISPTGDLAYIAESGGSQVSVIRVSNHTLMDQVTVGSEPHRLAFSPLPSTPRAVISLGQTVLRPQDLLQLDVRLLTPDSPPPGGTYRFEGKLWLKSPMPSPKDLFSIINLAGPQALSLPAGFDQTFRAVDQPLPADFSPGIYELGVSLADTVTGQEISLDIQPFSVIGP